MRFHKLYRIRFASLLCFVLPIFASAADKKEKGAAAEADKPSYELSQPATESLDYTMYQRIRDEGLAHSHVMDFASALADGIGPRLTGSPNLHRANEWTRDQLTAMGCSNAHLEDWGEFGMGWQQLNTWVRMSSPDTAVFIAQAAPWSPSTNGAVSGPAIWVDIKDEKDFEKYKGKLAGKIVLLGDMREVKPVDKALFTRTDDKDLAKIAEFPLEKPQSPADRLKDTMKRRALLDKTGKFLAEEHALAVILPSRDGRDNGGSGGIIFDDNGSYLTRYAYQRDHADPLPVVVAAIENYGRVYRLLKANVPVSIEINVDVKYFGDHEHGFDTVAEIPGTDPKLRDEVVMVGGHLDSWASATGATDNGAGTVVAMEVMRILNALQVKPRRTIRIGLWTGEEQGLFGSTGYVKQHFGYVQLSTAPDQLELPEWLRKPAGPVVLKPEQPKISGYFNVDNGTGKILRDLSAEERRCRVDLCAMDGTAERSRRHYHLRAQHRRHRPRIVRCSWNPGLPVHSGRPRLRLAHASFEHGYLRTLAARRPGAGRDRGGDLRIQHRHARPDAAAQATTASRTRRAALGSPQGDARSNRTCGGAKIGRG